MEDGAGKEPLAESIPQPRQVAGVANVWRGGGLDLESHHVTTGHLRKKVDLVPSVLLPQVIQARAQWAELGLGPELRDHECVDHSAQQIAITQNGQLVESKGSRHQGGVDQVALRPFHEA